MNPRLRPAPDVPPLPFPDAPATSPAPPAAPSTEASACAWDHCPNCGTHLVNQRCKYRCPRCHYFMSCSDFD